MHSLRKFTLALALYIALAINGSLSFFMHHFLTIGGGTNLFLPVGVMLIALFDQTNKKEIWLALIAGIVSDIYFFGVIGIYTVSLPCICWLLQMLARFLPEFFWAKMLAVILATIFLNAYSWLILNITGLASVSPGQLLSSMLPTLGWALLFAGLTYKIWANLAINYPFMVNLDNYRQ